jgi:hypothetical protein
VTQTKHLWIVPLAIAAVVAFVGWWANLEVRRTIEQEIRDDLQTTLDANVTALEIWMANQKRVVSALAEEPRLKSIALELLSRAQALPTNRPGAVEIPRQTLASERLSERLSILGYNQAELVATNFVVVAEPGRLRPRTSQTVAEELRPRFAELFTKGEPILITPFKYEPVLGFGPRPGGRREGNPQRGIDPLSRGGRAGRGGMFGGRGFASAPAWLARLRELTVMQVAAPIKDDQGITRGALSLRINLNPDAEFTRILSVASPGDSGETLAFDPEGVLLSNSRFDAELRKLGLIRTTRTTARRSRCTCRTRVAI